MPVPPVIQMYRYVMGSGGGLGNLLKASEEFQQTVDWVRYPTSSQTPTVNADSRPDPNGGTTADQVDYTANTSARLQQTVTLSASTQYTFSVHARAVSGTVDFRMRNVTLKDSEVKTATTTGPDGGGFTRFTYTFITGAAGSYELALQNDTNATAKDVIFWGAMLNQGGTAADYEYAAPTTGGSAPTPAYSGFGDSFGGVTAYYSLRQFTEAETLNAIRVRRSSDDTEQDIGFDANGDLDTTALTTFVNADVDIYTSDFSSTEDLSETNGTGAAAQSVGGVSDAYKFTLSGGSNQHNAFILNEIVVGQNIELAFDYYIPEGQVVDGLRVSTLAPIVSKLDVNVTGSWQTATVNYISDRNDIFFNALSGSNLTIDADGDVFYLKNIVVTQTTADGAVTTFYDQSGNGNNATNATASEQPLVVSGGTLVEENSKAAVDFDGSQLLYLSSFSVSQPFTNFAVNKFTATNVMVYGSNDDVYNWWNRGARVDIYAGVLENGATSSSSTQQSLYSLFDGANSEVAVNNNTATLVNSGTNNLIELVIGSNTATAGLSSGQVTQEIIIFDSDQSANRTGIESNINDHFDIYTP